MLAATLFVAGCTDYADYDERLTYLRTVAQRGADTHALIVSQEANIDRQRCERAFDGLLLNDDAPDIDWVGNELQKWQAQIKEFFVDSCISGKPKPVPGDPAASPSASVSAPTNSGLPTPSATVSQQP